MLKSKIKNRTKKNIVTMLIATTGFISSVVLVKASEKEILLISVRHYDSYREYESSENTVKEFLEEQGIEVLDTDRINIPVELKLKNVNEIVITEGIDIKIKINDREEITKKVIVGTTVAELLNIAIKENPQLIYNYEGDHKEILVEDKVYQVEILEEVETINIKIQNYEKIVEYVKNKEKKDEIVVYGVQGLVEVKKTEIIKDGVLLDVKIEEVVIKEPINEVRRVYKENLVEGTDGTYTYSKVINMNATAYTSGYESTGKTPSHPAYGITASGMKARRGVVAVDTRVIPFGTRLYVEGYGEAIAGDTGGAIKGNKIDLYYDKVSDALQFGRRDLNVYVLEDIE